MSETDKGSMDVPPVGVFVPDDRGLVAWNPTFDRISVEPDPREGRIVLKVDRSDEPSVSISLTPVAARWLADLLRSTSFAAEAEEDVA